MTPSHAPGEVPLQLNDPFPITGSPLFFTFTEETPIITSISPAYGAPGTNVVITGDNLGYISSVLFGETHASYVVNSRYQITATAPEQIGGYYEIFVSNTAGTTNFSSYENTQCFLKGTKILCSIDGTEEYVPIENIKKGTLIKTLGNIYIPVHSIGKKNIYNSPTSFRNGNQIFECNREKYPELIENLYITGWHSILVDYLSPSQKHKIMKEHNNIFITADKYRLMAFIDDKADIFKMQGEFQVFHIALENENIYINYGIYANGLLVESSNIANILSTMEIVE